MEPTSNTPRMVRCLFHEDEKPSMGLWPDGTFYCYGCKRKGVIHSVPDVTPSTEAPSMDERVRVLEASLALAEQTAREVQAINEETELRHAKELADREERIEHLKGAVRTATQRANTAEREVAEWRRRLFTACGGHVDLDQLDAGIRPGGL